MHDKHNTRKCPPEREFHDDMPVGIMIAMVEHRHDNIIREKLDALGAPKAFGGLLMQIRRNEGEMQSELAKRMNFSAPTISVTVQKLEESGYIERRPDESDQRQSRIWLTESGRQLTEAIHKTFCLCEESLLKNLSDEETSKLREILTKMYRNLAEEKSDI